MFFLLISARIRSTLSLFQLEFLDFLEGEVTEGQKITADFSILKSK
jgi:hypothetical protein